MAGLVAGGQRTAAIPGAEPAGKGAPDQVPTQRVDAQLALIHPHVDLGARTSGTADSGSPLGSVRSEVPRIPSPLLMICQSRVALQHAAAPGRAAAALARSRLVRLKTRRCARAEQPSADRRKAEVHLDRPPSEAREVLQQRASPRASALRTRQRLVRREASGTAVPLDLPVQRQQRGVAVPVPQLFFQELGAQVLHQLVAILAALLPLRSQV